MKNPVRPLVISNLLFEAGNNIIIPFIVFIVFSLNGSKILAGILAATYALFEFFAAPTMGKMSEIFGKKAVLLFTQTGTAVSWFIFLIALQVGKTQPTLAFFLLFLARALDGCTAGQISLFLTYLSELSFKKEKKMLMHLFILSSHWGTFMGALTGSILYFFYPNEKLLVLCAFAISLFCLLFLYWKLPDIRSTPPSPPSFQIPYKKWIVDLKTLVQFKHTKLFLFLYFIIVLNADSFHIIFSILASEQLNWSIFHFGIFKGGLSGLTFIIQYFLMKRLFKLFSNIQLLFLGLGLMTMSFYFFSQPHFFPILLSMVLFSFGNGILWPSFLNLFSQLSPDQSLLQGLGRSMASLASLMGLSLGSMLYLNYQNKALLLGSSSYLLLIFLIKIFYLSPKYWAKR